ncbi:UNVERIFIED_CONTAM: UDP-glucose iridoid glucosyltransferase [Sesamum angustifolium]|uniref:UDP-glucose iridoid glucosyltransferase n=1 Tax=Sesamum angustifolium TaxID=2727405 RepID=A0AAW2QQV7_9LAMI
METSELERRRRRGMVLVPSPFQGHITPMLQLGSILHSKGFSIHIAHTKFNSPNPSNFPHFTFLPLPDNLDCFDTSFHNLLNVISVVNTNCEAPFQEHMMKMVADEEVCGRQVACIIYDSIMNFVDAVAGRVKLPSIVLRTTTAAYMHSHNVMFQLLAENLIPLPGLYDLERVDLSKPPKFSLLVPLDRAILTFGPKLYGLNTFGPKP